MLTSHRILKDPLIPLERLTYLLASLLVGFLLAKKKKKAHDNHTIPLLFEIPSAKVRLIPGGDALGERRPSSRKYFYRLRLSYCRVCASCLDPLNMNNR